MACKCKITCVKIWMCLAVCGCLITLLLAGIVLSSYSFETVIGPLQCKLKKIEMMNCCYDNDCIYGKQYKYYFSSNSSHCMSKYDISADTHPINKSVRFHDETLCYPSQKSLKQSSANWRVNDSVSFYVNKECTDWIEATKHHSTIRTNLIWISVILTFVGCSCLSMICGFITMYHSEVITLCGGYLCCDKYILKSDENQSEQMHSINTHSKNEYNNPSNHASENRSETSTADGLPKYANINNGISTHSKELFPSPMRNMTDPHLSIEYMSKNHQLYSGLHPTSHTKSKSHRNRPRGHSTASKISRLSPLSDSRSNENINIRTFIANQNEHKHIPINNRIVISKPDSSPKSDSIKKRERELKEIIFDNHAYNINNGQEIYPRYNGSNEEDIDLYSNNEIVIDDMQSNGFSASIEFENEWYDENASKYTTNTGDEEREAYAKTNRLQITRNMRTTSGNSVSHRVSNTSYQNEELEEYEIDDDDYQE